MTTKRALLTGCSTGFGRATALELSARGWDVLASARRMEWFADLDVAGTAVLDVDADESAVVRVTGRVLTLKNIVTGRRRAYQHRTAMDDDPRLKW